MRWLLLLILLAWVGCARSRDGDRIAHLRPASGGAVPVSQSATNKPQVIITPTQAISGKIVWVNATARYVVISYPIGQLLPLEQRCLVYRAGLKVGEVRISGPRRDFNTVADIMAGECQVGDEVRAE